MCFALIFVFRDRYPINLLTSFLHDPILSTSDDPVLSVTESINDTSSVSGQEDIGIPVEVVPEEASGTEVVIPDAAEERFPGLCYQTMSLEQRLIYEQLYEGIAAREQEFYIDAKEAGDIGLVLNGLLADNPEFFWMDGAASIYGLESRSRKKITLEFNCEPEEIDYLLDTLREAQHTAEHPEEYDAAAWYVRPTVLECDVVRFQNNKDKWIAFVGIRDGKPYEIFTGLADDEQGIALPKSVTRGKIIRAENEDGTRRYDFQFVNSRGFKTTVEGLSYKFDKEFWNYARLLSGILRNGMPIEQVVHLISSMQMDSDSINSWATGVARALKRYIPGAKEEPTDE